MRKLGHVHGTKQRRNRRRPMRQRVGTLHNNERRWWVNVYAGDACPVHVPATQRRPDRWDGYDVQVVA